MNSTRKTSVVVGSLFIAGTLAGTVMASLTGPLVSAPDYLNEVASNSGIILWGALLQFLMALFCASIGLALYPLLKKYHAGLAIGSAGFRLIEGVCGIIGAAGLISLLAVSQEFVKADAASSSYFQTLGVMIKAGRDWVSNVAMLISWCVGAFMYYAIFYKEKLVPRWLSVWGLAGVTLTVISSLLVMFKTIPAFGTIQVVSNLPIALQEMVLALWLLFKGFTEKTSSPSRD